jgi:hypothetical protein
MADPIFVANTYGCVEEAHLVYGPKFGGISMDMWRTHPTYKQGMLPL